MQIAIAQSSNVAARRDRLARRRLKHERGAEADLIVMETECID
jgi:hypothetical protein